MENFGGGLEEAPNGGNWFPTKGGGGAMVEEGEELVLRVDVPLLVHILVLGTTGFFTYRLFFLTTHRRSWLSSLLLLVLCVAFVMGLLYHSQVLLGLLAGLGVGRTLTRDTTSGLTVATTSGELTGTVNATSPNVRQFLGIPYAQPPVGALRFQPPVKYTFQGPLDANAFSPSCFQPLTTPEAAATSLYDRYLQGFLPGSPDQGEDCLTVNVYAPLKPVAESLPVLIYVHGGGFSSDGSNVPYQIPDSWIERTQGHVVVTMNYRLNIFGFPNAAAQSLNVGLLDQRMAVEWARDNVAAFGGDPDRMVLWGQSAGAWSVNYYGYAYPEDPIVKGLIANSGGSDIFNVDEPHSNFTSIASLVGCGNNADAAAELACMQQVDAKTLQALYSNTTGVRFGPVVDERTVFPNNTERALKGLVAKIPAIVGVNSREGTAFGDWTVEGGMDEADVLPNSKLIVCPTISEIQNRLDAGLTTHRYLYTGNFSNITPLPWIGAVHSGELPLLFGTHDEYRGNSTEFEWDVSYAMQGLWLSFASDTSADPHYESFSWPKYDPNVNTTVVFAEDGVVTQLGNHWIDSICD